MAVARGLSEDYGSGSSQQGMKIGDSFSLFRVADFGIVATATHK